MKNLITIGKYVLLLLLTSLCCVSCDVFDEDESFTVNVKIGNGRNEALYFYADNQLKHIIPAKKVLTTAVGFTGKKSGVLQVKTVEGIILDYKTVKDGDYYIKDFYPNETCIYVKNTTGDNYDIYIDDVLCGTSPAGTERTVKTTPGKHQLTAKQKDGYVFFETVRNKTIECDYGDYLWNFDENVFKEIE